VKRAAIAGPLILELLLERGAVTETDLHELSAARRRFPNSLEEALVRSDIVEGGAIAAAYAEHLSLPLLEDTDDLRSRCGDHAERVPEIVCRHRLVAPVGFDDGVLEVAFVNPTDLEAHDEVQLFAGFVLRPVVAPLELIDLLHEYLFGARDMVREIASQEGAKSSGPVEPDDGRLLDLDRPVPSGKEGQVVRIVNFILKNAIRDGASDVHLEPYEDAVRVRYRVDGQLIETTPPPRSLFLPVVSRLKVLAKLDIAERRVPQDGSIALRESGTRVDLRVNTVPTVHGEKMVLRILPKEATPDSLEALGFSAEQARLFEHAASSHNGLIFVTGPTGSGKSTTLYTSLNLINRENKNIVTVEDPVEYRFEGLNQCHVRSNVGLTFASALRAFLRQDPDIIMVGEVRDQETAEVCLRAALTGHLVLSTLHTNDSLQAINRLVDMAIEPFLLGPALRLVQAQRLARRLCPECRVAYDVHAATAARFGIEPGTTLYHGSQDGCGACRGNGYRGRVGIYEVVPVTERLRDLIMDRATMGALRRAVAEDGVHFLADSAREKVVAGVTSLEEVSDYLRPDTGVVA